MKDTLYAQEKRQKNKKEVYSPVSDKESVKDYKQFILELVGSHVRMQKFQRAFKLKQKQLPDSVKLGLCMYNSRR